jgi:RHS repeat-associated protein
LFGAHSSDSASRLYTVTDNTTATPYSATYSYIDNSPLSGQIDFAANGANVMSISKQYDYLNRLTAISTVNPQAATISSFSYSYNTANQRTNATVADNSRWVYTYDSLGQVISGKKYWPDGTAVAGQQFDYSFDDIGNRTWTTNNSRAAHYLANSLNQYTSRDVPGFVNALGSANSNATVTVWADNALYAATSRKGEYFRGELSVNNSTGAMWLTLTNVAVLPNGTNADVLATAAGKTFPPKSAEQFYYDKDGSLTNDGRWTYRWDAENRLVSLTPNSATGPRQSIKFEYDWQGRRIHKQLWSNTTWSGTPTNDVKFIYDGWNVLAELNATNNAVIRSFMWGLDLSASLQGAGGGGGLLAIKYIGTQTTNCFVACDGNGNVAALADTASTNILARYEYGPFGELLRATGPMAKANPFRFSTQYQDDETDLMYFHYRYYSPPTGRWLSRDPIGEPGFDGNQYFTFSKDDLQALAVLDPEDENFDALEAAQKSMFYTAGKLAYLMVNNDPINGTDLHGLVYCRIVANRTKAMFSSSINLGHEWIDYDGKTVGFWPNRGFVVLRPDPAAQTGATIFWQWDTVQKKSGTIKWGPAAGKSCVCATCEEIMASINAAPNPGWHSFEIRNNCRRFVKWVFDGSCLKKGKKISFHP